MQGHSSINACGTFIHMQTVRTYLVTHMVFLHWLTSVSLSSSLCGLTVMSSNVLGLAQNSLLAGSTFLLVQLARLIRPMGFWQKRKKYIRALLQKAGLVMGITLGFPLPVTMVTECYPKLLAGRFISTTLDSFRILPFRGGWSTCLTCRLISSFMQSV